LPSANYRNPQIYLKVPLLEFLLVGDDLSDEQRQLFSLQILVVFVETGVLRS
jgi:hypothetical protein